MKKAFIYILALLVTGLSAAACHDEDLPASDGGGTSVTGSPTYIKLCLSLQRGSRSSGPTGGEYGDGAEQGINKENDIHNLTLFIYSADKGANDAENTPVTYCCYMEDVRFFPKNEDDVSYTTLPIPVNALVNGRTRVIVACNMGNLSDLHTVGEIRDYAVRQTWRPGASVGEADYFTMASEDEAEITLRDASGKLLGESPDSPVHITLGVERTAARIDFCANPELPEGAEEPFCYAAKPYTGAAPADIDGHFYLTHVRPVNVMQSPSRLLKATAIAPLAGAVLDYYGIERLNVATGLAENYVMEPTTLLKTEQNRTNEALLLFWFGGTAVANSLSPDYFTDAYKTAAREKLRVTEEKDGTKVKSYIVGYAHENTMPEQFSVAEYVTGLALRGEYVPRTVYSDAAGTIAADYERGRTFWRYLPMRQEDLGKGARYFSSAEAAEAYRAAHPAEAAQITEYVDGQCYYYIWIRHAGNDQPAVGPMEYGIVRNNIYRIGINSLVGPGSNVPDPRGPNVIRSIIYVKKWNLRREDDIYM